MPIKKVKSKRFKQGFGYRLSIDRAGLPRIRQTFRTEREARQIEEAILGDHVRRKFNLPVESRVTIKQLVEKHLTITKAKGRDRVNWKRSETVLNRFRDLVGPDRPVEQIRRADLQEYATARLSEKIPPKPQTINREMNEIKSCLTSASKYYPALEDYQSPRGAWLEEPADGRRQTWTREQVAAVLAELLAPRRKGEKAEHVSGRRAVADMFVVALQTGMRAGEVRRLRKSQINFARRIITITSKKGMSARRSATTREVPMTDEVFEVLKQRYGDAQGEYLFPGTDPHKPLSDHRKTFKTACKRAKVSYGRDGDGTLIFNDARRTAENFMLESGHQPRAVGDVLGHSAETMARHYARSTAASRRAAVESVKNFGGILEADTATTATTAQDAQESKTAKASN